MKKTAKQIFDEINETVFSGELENPVWNFDNFKNAQGGFCYDGETVFINVNPKWCLTYENIFGIIAHEMAHYYLFINGKKYWKHNLTFIKVCRIIASEFEINPREII